MKLRALAMYRSRNLSSTFTALSYQPKPGTNAGYSHTAYVVDPPAKHVDCWLTFSPSFAFSAPDLRDFVMAGFKIRVFEPETQEGFVLTCAVCDQPLYPAERPETCLLHHWLLHYAVQKAALWKMQK